MKNIKIIIFILIFLATNNTHSFSEVTASVPTNLVQRIASAIGHSANDTASPEIAQQIQSITSSVVDTKQLKADVEKDAKIYGLQVDQKALARLTGESTEDKEGLLVTIGGPKNIYEDRIDLEPTLDTYIYDTGLMDLTIEGNPYAADGDNIFDSAAGKQQARIKVYLDFKRRVQWGDVEARVTLSGGTQSINNVKGGSSAITSLPLDKQLNYFVNSSGAVATEPDDLYLFDKHDKNSLLKSDGSYARFDDGGDHATDSGVYKEFTSHGLKGSNNVAIQAQFTTSSAGTDGTSTASFEASSAAANASDANFKAKLVRYSATATTKAAKYTGD